MEEGNRTRDLLHAMRRQARPVHPLELESPAQMLWSTTGERPDSTSFHARWLHLTGGMPSLACSGQAAPR